MDGEQFDFVVVGAGSAGCVLANRLSADPRNSVALIEAGPRDRSFWIHLPIGYGRTMWDPKVNWKFYTEPEPQMDGRRIYWPRGRVLGGSSSINGLIVIRGQPQDYDHWADLGNRGWSWRDVLPYFIKLEHNDDLAGDQLHGSSGPLQVTSIHERHELIEAFIAAANRQGIPRTSDFNGREQEGAGYFQLTTHNGWRNSSADAYLRPVAKRGNLRILTDTQVGQVLFAGRRAVGVTCRSEGSIRTITARRGVVLAAGAIQSPQLLMLSGIGPAEELQRHGIAVKLNRPAVGQNLQDHLQFRLIYRITKPITTNDALRSLWGRFKLGSDWLLHRRGALAVGINQGGLFARLQQQAKTPDIQFHVATLSADMAGGKVHDFSGMTLSVCQLRPQSRGSIGLASADPFDRPAYPRQLSRGGKRLSLCSGQHRFCTQARSDPAAVRLHRRRGDARSERAERRRHFRVCAGQRRDDLSSGRDLPHGIGRRRGRRSAVARARRRSTLGGRLFDHADAGVGQHQRAGNDDRRKGGRLDHARLQTTNRRE